MQDRKPKEGGVRAVCVSSCLIHLTDHSSHLSSPWLCQCHGEQIEKLTCYDELIFISKNRINLGNKPDPTRCFAPSSFWVLNRCPSILPILRYLVELYKQAFSSCTHVLFCSPSLISAIIRPAPSQAGDVRSCGSASLLQ